MAQVTLSILEGLERGLLYDDLETPITIGREEDNDVQLNDERVSRIHAKLQEDNGDVILTDLNSTNGSRVNGHPVQLRVLQPGDHVQIGRCTLLYGSDKEISSHASRIGVDVAALTPLNQVADQPPAAPSDSESGFQLAEGVGADNLRLPLFPGGAPDLPSDLDPGSRARMADVLAYVHERLRDVTFEGAEVLAESSTPGPDGRVEVPWERWQNVLQLQRDLASYLRQVANPE